MVTHMPLGKAARFDTGALQRAGAPMGLTVSRLAVRGGIPRLKLEQPGPKLRIGSPEP